MTAALCYFPASPIRGRLWVDKLLLGISVNSVNELGAHVWGHLWGATQKWDRWVPWGAGAMAASVGTSGCSPKWL